MTFSAQLNSQSSALFDNHLSLLASNELRTKLSELNEKLNGAAGQSTGSNSIEMFKEIIDLIYLNDDETSIPDIAACISIVLRNEFTNNLLKMNATNPSKSSGFKSSSQQQLPNKSNNNVKHLDFYKYDIFSLVNNKLFANYVNDLFVNGANNQRFILFNCLFKELIKTKNQSPQREALIHLLNEIYMKQNRLGYFFLFYISALCLVNMKLNGDENGLNKLSKRKRLRQYSEITKQTIAKAFRKSDELKRTLMIYNEFISEYLKTNSTGSNMNLTGSSSKNEMMVNALSSKNQISTYDSDLSEEDEDDDDEDASDSSSSESGSENSDDPS